jgi:hypothetical protein
MLDGGTQETLKLRMPEAESGEPNADADAAESRVRVGRQSFSVP